MLEEKLKPKTLKEFWGRKDEISHIYKEIKKTGIMPHIALIGPAGCGKTLFSNLLAKAVLKKNFKSNFFSHNASEDFSVDFFRNTIIPEARTKVLGGGKKCILMDEFDGSSAQAQATLRVPMVDYSDQTRFIITGNYRNKIIDPIISRCKEIHFAPFKAGKMRDFILEMAKRADIKISEDDAKNLALKAGGDQRKAVQVLEEFSMGKNPTASSDELLKLDNKTFFEMSFTVDPYTLMERLYEEAITDYGAFDLIPLFATANRDFGSTPIKEWVVQNLFYELKKKLK